MNVCLRLLNKVFNALTMPLGKKKTRKACKSKLINMFSEKYFLSLELVFLVFFFKD